MKFAFFGAGRMALALAQGMLRSGQCAASDLLAVDRSAESLEHFVRATGATATTHEEAARAAEVILLCVKPPDAIAALQQAKGMLRDRLVISIVTGLKAAALEQAAPGCRVIRTMPNTAAMVGKSATALVAGSTATESDLAAATKIFGSVGEVFSITESQIDAVTGLSGSGPAFLYLVMEALSDAGVAVGLPRPLALDLAIQTFAGATEMASSTKLHPAMLREMVTSPGGTTIAGLAVLEQEAVRAAFGNAVKAAAARAKELSS